MRWVSKNTIAFATRLVQPTTAETRLHDDRTEYIVFHTDVEVGVTIRQVGLCLNACLCPMCTELQVSRNRSSRTFGKELQSTSRTVGVGVKTLVLPLHYLMPFPAIDEFRN